jgi:L-amino acid N-acyltransferase YncA
MDWQITPMRPEDWAAVREIYREGVATGNATLETELPEWKKMGQRASPGLPFRCA